MAAVYLDNNATTPLDSRVRDAMLPWLGELHGNPSSIHSFGQHARDAVENARLEVAALIGARAPEIVFTCSGTEANNGLLWDLARSFDFSGHLVVSSLEHPSVRVMTEHLAGLGMELSVVAPSSEGVVELESVERELRPDTRVVCLMSASNEIGTQKP